MSVIDLEKAKNISESVITNEIITVNDEGLAYKIAMSAMTAMVNLSITNFVNHYIDKDCDLLTWRFDASRKSDEFNLIPCIEELRAFRYDGSEIYIELKQDRKRVETDFMDIVGVVNLIVLNKEAWTRIKN